jgi:hypothetical protein
MGATDNRELVQRQAVQKANDLTLTYLTAENAVVPPKRARRFVEKMRRGTVLMKKTDLQFLGEAQETIDFIAFPDRLLRDAQHGVALPEGARTRPDFSQVDITTELYRGEMLVEMSVFEDNLAGQALATQIENALSKKAGEEMEEYLINSDTGSLTDPEYAKQDGLLKLATSNVVDAGGANINDEWLTKVRQALPEQYQETPRMMNWTARNVWYNWRSYFKNRLGEMADKALTRGDEVPHEGQSLMKVPYWPEDYGGADTTAVLYMDPKNVAVRIHRKLKINVVPDYRAETIVYVISLRYGWQYREEDRIVKLINVAISK